MRLFSKFVLFAPLLLAEENGEKHGGFGHATDGHGHAVHHAVSHNDGHYIVGHETHHHHHGHGHGHGYDHGHGHGHGYDHGHGHDHGHGYDHGHGHGHGHGYGHGHHHHNCKGLPKKERKKCKKAYKKHKKAHKKKYKQHKHTYKTEGGDDWETARAEWEKENPEPTLEIDDNE